MGKRHSETQSNESPSTVTVAIIGGGFSGAILAAQLLRHSDPSLSIAVVEKASSVGRGLAYETECASLLLNVRARNMSAFPDDPHHFLRWAQSNYDPATGPGSFLPRAVYGHYVQAVLNEAAQSAGKPRLNWIRDEAVALSPTRAGATEIRSAQRPPAAGRSRGPRPGKSSSGRSFGVLGLREQLPLFSRPLVGRCR